MRILIVLLTLFWAAGATAETLLVGNKNDNTVSFVDLATGEEVFRTATGRSPHEVALSPDGETLVVVSYRTDDYVGHELNVFDVATGTHVKTIDIMPNMAPHGIQWLPGTDSVVVAVQEPNNAIQVDINSGQVTRSAATGQDDSHLIVLTSDASRGYVTNRGSSTVSVIDMTTFEPLATLSSDAGAEAIDISPDDTTLWIGNREANTITVFDLDTLEQIRAIDAGYDPVRLQFSPDGSQVAVADFSGDRLVIYDAASSQEVATLDLHEAEIDAPSHVMFSPVGPVVFVSGQKNGKVAEIDVASWTVNRVFDVADGADGTALSDVVLTAPE